jgi:GR25 family glycosyltransferase involved in LPS biosynthesis
MSPPAILVVKYPEMFKSLILENNGNTEFINKYFDRIYVINLRRRQNKLAEITQKLKRLNISAEIIEAVDGYKTPHIDEYEVYKNIPLSPDYASPEEIKLNRKLIYSPGVWGHLKSNRLILQDALAEGYQKILILEDDVLFMKNFHHEFENFTGIISGKNWKFLYLGATQASWDIPGCISYPDKSVKTYQPGQPFYHPVSTVGSFALAIHYSQFKSIISKIDEMNCPFDWIYKLSFKQLSEQSFVAQPNLIIADNAESDNMPENITSDQKLLAITRRKWDLTKYD